MSVIDLGPLTIGWRRPSLMAISTLPGFSERFFHGMKVNTSTGGRHPSKVVHRSEGGVTLTDCSGTWKWGAQLVAFRRLFCVEWENDFAGRKRKELNKFDKQYAKVMSERLWGTVP